MIKIGRYLLSFIVLFFAFAVNATVTVQSSVDRTEMGRGDTFTITVAVISDESVEIQEPRLPELDGFQLLNTWSSTAVAQKLVNTGRGMEFQTQRRKEFQYQMSVTKDGNLSVGSFEVVVEGKVYRTQPILLKVSQHAQGTPKRPRGGGGAQQGMPGMPPGFDTGDDFDSAEEEIFNQLLQQRQRLLQQGGAAGGGTWGVPDEEPQGGASGAMKHPDYRSLPTNPNEAFFIQVEVDKTDVYEGEQVTVNWYLYTRGQMETLDRLKFPSLRGFWKEIIEEVPSIQFSEEVVSGVVYKKALLASHALFPIKAGKAVIDEYKIKSRIRLPVNGMGGFFARPYEFTKSSNRVEINVKPLPVEGRPADFTGAVGQFDVNAHVEGTQFPVSQPFSLKVRFEGAGNAKVIDLPAIAWPAGVEVYDTKSESKFFKNGRSFKEFEVLLIPRQEGVLTIPSFTVSMFDPREKKYYSKNTAPITLQINPNANGPSSGSSRIAGGSGEGKQVIREDVLPDIVQTWQPSVASNVTAQPMVWLAVFVSVLGALLFKAQKELSLWGNRRKTLKELVAKRFKTVDAAVGKSDFRLVGTEMTNIYYVVLGEIAGSGGASLEIDKLLEMAPPSIRRDHGADIKKSFETFQTLSFAPEEMLGSLKEKSSLKENTSSAEKLINNVISAIGEK